MGERIEIQAADGTAEAYLTGEAGRPGVLLLRGRDRAATADRVHGRPDRLLGLRRAGPARVLPRRQRRRARPAGRPARGRRPRGVLRLRRDGPRRRAHPRPVGPDAEAWVATLLEHAGDGPIGTSATAWARGSPCAPPGSSPARSAPSAASTAVAWSRRGRQPPPAVADSTAEFVFGHADQDASMPLEAVGDPRGGPHRRRTAPPERDLRRGPARLLDGRHLDVRRGRRGAALRRAAGAALAHP